MDDELMIEPINTSKKIPLKMEELRREIVNLQTKVNEIIDVLNEQFAPDDDYVDDDDEDDEDEKIVVSPSDLTFDKRKPRKMN